MIERFYYLIFLNIILIASFLSGCLTAGTHGSLKSYEIRVNKYVLQTAVENALESSQNIKRDTNNNYIIDITNNRNDTIFSNYYNDDDTYLSIRIKSESEYYDYTIQYAGDKNNWEKSKISYLSIVYAYDQDGNGGSEGNGGIGRTLRSKMIKIFEREFITKIEKELNQNIIDSN